MSWDHYYYEAICKKCGAIGFKISSSDNWGASEISWERFSPFRDFPNHSYLVDRQRIDINEYAKCTCGSTDIEVGSEIVKTR